MGTRISLVIPAYNEERYLPRLLEGVAAARSRYRGAAGANEVIVADNGSSDDTRAIARARGCAIVDAKPRRIGAVRNAGAHAASGEILAFVDADFRIHPTTFDAIDDYFADGTRVVGLTGCVPERSSLGIEMSWRLLGAFTAAIGYGVPGSRSECMPSGVVCCRREDWERVGGYCERRAFFEDLRFVLDLQDLGRRRGQFADGFAARPRCARCASSIASATGITSRFPLSS